MYSLPTHKYNNVGNNFRRYSSWLESRNKLIQGFTKSIDKYYMAWLLIESFTIVILDMDFFTECGILRCSSVWCICGHKQLSDRWASNNKQLDEFIKKTQLQQNSPNHAYLEWISFDCIKLKRYELREYLYGLPTHADVELIPQMTGATHDS